MVVTHPSLGFVCTVTAACMSTHSTLAHPLAKPTAGKMDDGNDQKPSNSSCMLLSPHAVMHFKIAPRLVASPVGQTEKNMLGNYHQDKCQNATQHMDMLMHVATVHIVSLTLPLSQQVPGLLGAEHVSANKANKSNLKTL